jgi:hypothetical protein
VADAALFVADLGHESQQTEILFLIGSTGIAVV